MPFQNSLKHSKCYHPANLKIFENFLVVFQNFILEAPIPWNTPIQVYRNMHTHIRQEIQTFAWLRHLSCVCPNFINLIIRITFMPKPGKRSIPWIFYTSSVQRTKKVLCRNSWRFYEWTIFALLNLFKEVLGFLHWRMTDYGAEGGKVFETRYESNATF